MVFGVEETFADDYVGLPDDIVIDYTDQKSVDRLIESVPESPR